MCCYSIAKYLLFAFNFVFWLAGCALLGVGIWLNVDSSTQQSVEIADVTVYWAGAIVLIVAGCIMLVVGFFGCCGAIKESTCLLGTYFGLLFVIFGLEVGIGIWALVTYPSMESAITAAMDELPIDEFTKDSALVATQKNLQCCGTTAGCGDWPGNNPTGCGCNKQDAKNASNCVMAASQSCNTDPTASTDYIYAQPCSAAIYDLISSNMIIIGGIALAIGLAEILGMIISMCLCCSIKKKNKGHHV